MQNLFIVGILVDTRKESAPKVQEILTSHGNKILSRFGTHDPGEENHGLIVLTVRESESFIKELVQQLEQLEGVTVKFIQMK